MPKRTDISKIIEFGLTPITIAAVAVLFLGGTIFAECVEVEGVRQSSRRLQIITAIDSQAAPGVSVQISQVNFGQKFSLISDASGVVHPPVLAPGLYRIVAASSDAVFRGELQLEVSQASKKQVSVFFLSLLRTPSQVPVSQRVTKEELLTAIRKISDRIRISKFSGLLVDSSGAAIPGADVVILRVTATASAEWIDMKSGDNGQFAVSLPDGMYVAFFQMPGFRTEIIAFEITDKAPVDLRIAMRVAGC